MSLHVHSTPHGANEAGFIERGEAVRRPHQHTGSVWQAVIAWLRAIRTGQGQFDKNP